MMAEEITVGSDGLFQIEQGERGYGLYVGGKPLYEMVGGECDTCGGWFSLVDGPARPCTPADLSKRLGSGLDRVDRPLLDLVTLLLPKGRYTVGLLRAIPFQRGDNEWHWFESRAIQREVWRTMPAESSLEVPSEHTSGHVERYVETEDILPHIPLALVDWDRVSRYRHAIRDGARPTAMVLSMGEIRHPQGERTEVRLTHFVIDGHHKLLAAAQTGRPLTLLSFFAHDHSRLPIDRFHTRHPDEYATERLADVEVERLWLEQQRRLCDLDSPS
jgi:hypothetical protein